MIGLVAGGLAGWRARPVDLLSPTIGGRPAPPALWIAPDWDQVPRKNSAVEQYRHALLSSNANEREAAWVAVSGYFPENKEWASKSFTQLARELFRRRDSDRLGAFADVLASTKYGRNEVLAQVMNAGVAALEGDDEKVINFFLVGNDSEVRLLVDAGVAEFGLEVILRLKEDRRARRSPNVADKIREAEAKLLQKLIEIKRRDLQG